MFGWILLGIVILVIIIYMLIGFIFHHFMFSKRFSKDPIVKYYSVDMFEGFKYEPIEFNYNKGKLKGNIYFYDFEKYKGIIVFSHGMFSNHEAYLQEIEYLAKNGYKVIGFDYYGVEYSEGKRIRGLGNSLACLDFVVFEVLNKLFKNEKVFVMGHSWGGFASLNIQKYHPRLSGVVAMAPFVHVSNLLKGMVSPYLYPAIPFFILKDYLSCGKYSLDNGINTLKEGKVKTLILHSKDDYMVKYYLNTYLLTEYVKRDDVKYYITNGKRHNPNYSNEAIKYTIEVTEELNKIPNEVKLEYRKSLNYQLMGKLDEEVMSKIIDFFDTEVVENE